MEKNRLRFNNGDTEKETRIKEKVAKNIISIQRAKKLNPPEEKIGNIIKLDLENELCDDEYKLLEEIIEYETYVPKPEWKDIEKRIYYLLCPCSNYTPKKIDIYVIYKQ